MKSQRECYEKLLRGKKLIDITDICGNYVCFNTVGSLINESGGLSEETFINFEDWVEYEEPEKIQELKTDEEGVALCTDACRKITELIKAVNKLMEDK